VVVVAASTERIGSSAHPQGLSHVASEEGNRITGNDLSRCLVASRQIDEIGERDAPFEEAESCTCGLDVLIGVAGYPTDSSGDQESVVLQGGEQRLGYTRRLG
jgi:hypothetical protein